MVRLVLAVMLGMLGVAATGAYGQSEPPPYVAEAPGGVAVWTQTPYVDRDSAITIHGYGESGPVTILVLNPGGNLADVVQLEGGGPFTVVLNTAGDYWKLDGWYRLTAKAGTDTDVFSLVLGVGVQCDDGSIPVDAGPEGVHCMVSDGASAVTLDASTRTMHLHVAEGGATLHIPRYLLDSQAGEADTQFAVLQQDEPIPYEEPYADADLRVIQIPAQGWVSVSGTHAVPEFGFALVVLAAAGTAAILPRLRRRIM